MRFTASNCFLQVEKNNQENLRMTAIFQVRRNYELTDVRTKESGITNIVSKETPFNGGGLLMP